MKSKLLKNISHILGVLLTVVLAMTYTSCSDEETTDTRGFVLYYLGMTDIGPSMSGIISEPSYKGSVPSEFTITSITLNGEPYTGSDFIINTETGAIEINSAKDTPVGLYKISISCKAGGSYHEYKDIVEVNMMKPVPDGITVEPNLVEVEYSIISDDKSIEELPTAQVKTDGNHISITKYEIAKSEISSFFKISQTGEITIVRGSDISPGIHTLSLKLTTGASSEDEGIFENALTINVTSKPLGLTYEPSEGLIEAETAEGPETTFKSEIPMLKGSLEDIAYSIESIEPSTDKIKIDPTTGVLSVDKHHGFEIDQQYVISVKVANKFATEGVSFKNVYTLKVVNRIAPIANFSYPATMEIYEAAPFKASPNGGLEGDAIMFTLQDDLNKQLSIDKDGIVSLEKGHSIPTGDYTITVIASNIKNSQEASFNLKVKNNPNKFTYIRYGNNIGVDVLTNANQFRITADKAADAPDILKRFSIAAPETDINQSNKVVWSIRNGINCNNVKIDASTGGISFENTTWPGSPKVNNSMGFCFVTATVGDDKDSEFTLEVPVFIYYDLIVSNVHVEYNPFVFHVNPKTIGNNTYSVVPKIISKDADFDVTQFTMDYRRSINYTAISGTFTDGDSKTSDFLNGLWVKYVDESGVRGANTGSRHAMSYYENTKENINTLHHTVGYADPGNGWAFKLNPNKWIVDGEYPHGILTFQMTIDKTGKDPVGGPGVFPLAIWFDPNI